MSIFSAGSGADNAARYRAEIECDVPRPDPEAAIAKYQGGVFIDEPIHRT